jgi:hypothetical protein
VDAKARCCVLRSLALLDISSDVGGVKHDCFYYEMFADHRFGAILKSASEGFRERTK